MITRKTTRPFEILLVEDNQGDVRLVQQATVAILRQPLRIVMTDEASFPRHAALGGRCRDVA